MNKLGAKFVIGHYVTACNISRVTKGRTSSFRFPLRRLLFKQLRTAVVTVTKDISFQ